MKRNSNGSTSLGVNLDAKAFYFVVLAFALKIALDAVQATLGFGHEALFFTQSDKFADSIKAALALRSVTEPLLTDSRVLGWPALFQDYLFNNSYLTPQFPLYQVPPLGILVFLGTAKIIVMSSPSVALSMLLAVYIAGVAMVSSLSRHGHGAVPSAPLRCAWLLCLSYPFLFMVDRGNFLSGFSTICVLTYVLTAVTGRGRLLGMALMILAINLRPNVALVTLLEFAVAARFMKAFLPLLVMAVLSTATMALAFAIAPLIDPAVSLPRFLSDYRTYEEGWVRGDAGLNWNNSLFGAVRSIRSLSGLAPAYDPNLARAIWLLGLALVLSFIGLAATRRISRPEAAFLATALCALFTPVFGQYHALMMLAPALVIVKEAQVQDTRLTGFWPSLVALIALCYIVQFAPAGSTAIALALGAFAIPFAIFEWQGRSPRTLSGLMLCASLLSMSAIGGRLTNGLAVSMLLVSSVLICMTLCWLRPDNGTRP